MSNCDLDRVLGVWATQGIGAGAVLSQSHNVDCPPELEKPERNTTTSSKTSGGCDAFRLKSSCQSVPSQL